MKNATFKTRKNKNINASPNVTVYVIKLGRSSGQLSNSAPCMRCTERLKESNVIKRIVYSNENGDITSVKLRDYTTNYLTLGDRING